MATDLTTKGKENVLDFLTTKAQYAWLYGTRSINGGTPESWSGYVSPRVTNQPNNLTLTRTNNVVSISSEVSFQVLVSTEVNEVKVIQGVKVGAISEADGSLLEDAQTIFQIPFTDGGGNPIDYEYTGSGIFTLTDLDIEFT